MPKKKYYAVRRGRKPGTYESHSRAQEQVHGFPGAEYKSFPTREQAEVYLRHEDPRVPLVDATYPYLEVCDGSRVTTIPLTDRLRAALRSAGVDV